MTLVLPSKVTGWLICTKARLFVPAKKHASLTKTSMALRIKDKKCPSKQSNRKNENTTMVCLED